MKSQEVAQPTNAPAPKSPLMKFVGWARRHWKKWAIPSVVSVAVAILVLIATGRNGDLIAWASVMPIYPSEQTKNLPLPLFLAQTPVKSLTFVNMEISNAGKVAIGRQEERWTLRITGPTEATLLLVGKPGEVGKPVPSSERLVVSPADSPATNIVAVQIGSLEPRDFFNVRLIVVNASHPSTPSLDVSTSLAGLPEPILTHESPEIRATDKVWPWLFAVLYGLLMYEAIRTRHIAVAAPEIVRGVKDWRTRLAGTAAYGLFMLLGVSAALSLAIGWIAVWLWRWKLLS